MAETRLSLMQKENLYEIIHNLPVFFDKSCIRCKERDMRCRNKCVERNKKILGVFT